MKDDLRILRFKDLQEQKIIPNRVTLARRIANQGFPRPFRMGPNTNAWFESEVVDWLKRRAAMREKENV